MLRLERDGDDLGWLTLSTAIQDESSAGIVTVVPGSLDQETPDVDVACFGDRSPIFSCTGRVLGGDKPEVGHEFGGEEKRWGPPKKKSRPAFANRDFEVAGAGTFDSAKLYRSFVDKV
jgi:hypothetical protein